MAASLAHSDGRDSASPTARRADDPESLEARHAVALAALQAAEIRRRCLADLGARLRRCETAAQISLAASEILGAHLDCSRTGYAVLEDDHTVIEADWTDGTLASLSGRREFSRLGGPYVEHISRGEIVIAPDVDTHPVTADGREHWRGIGVRSVLNVPLMEHGRLVAMIYAHQSVPRHWTADEVGLLQEVADRTWEAMSRARAVEALRRMNDTLETQVRDRTMQRDRMWMLSTDLMMVTSLEGVILSVNPAWTRLLGWRADELVGASFYTFVHPDDRPATRVERRKIEAGGAIDKLENRYVAKDGRTVWLSWKAVPDGEVVHSVARDITAEREQADALRAAEEALRQAQKMEAVGQLTGGIAHDFNNLLQGILGALQLSETRIARRDFDSLARYNAQAQQCAERAAALTHRLLAFSRRQPLDPRPVDANQLILTLEPLLRRTLGEGVRLELDLAADLWPTLCDPNQLDSALLNLSINARDAMPGGGVLTIRSRNAPDPDGSAGGETICLSVEDTGTGMAPDVMARAFDPFYTTKAIGQGTGLGLSMVYGFMRQSGGEARIASAPGAGTTVSLHFRRHDGREPAAHGNAAPPALRGEGAVLVIEDEISVRGFVVEALEQLGYQVLCAEDGPSGVEVLRGSRPIDLLLTDIGLPGLNGRQVADIARQTRPELKILFMTGYAEAAAMSEGFLEPGMGLITKPFPIEGLAERIRQIGRA
jgi:PAS domain S-box-containing protein